MEVTATQAPPVNPTSLARPENANNPNQPPQNQGVTPNTSDTVTISSAAQAANARVEATDNGSDNRESPGIENAEQARQTAQTVLQSTPAALLSAQGAPSSSDQVRNLLG